MCILTAYIWVAFVYVNIHANNSMKLQFKLTLSERCAFIGRGMCHFYIFILQSTCKYHHDIDLDTVDTCVQTNCRILSETHGFLMPFRPSVILIVLSGD